VGTGRPVRKVRPPSRCAPWPAIFAA
jgi:heme A synthase